MSSPDPKVPEMSSGSFVVSGTETPAKSHKQDMGRRRRETQQSPFKIPDNNSIFLLNEKHKFLTLPIDEKTTHTSHKMAKLKREVVGELEEQEKKDKIKNPKQIKSNRALPKLTSGRHELKMAMMKRENTTKESKHDLISMERQKAVLELELTTKRSEILRMHKAVAKRQGQLKQLEKLIERDNLNFEVLLRHWEKKSLEAQTCFEQEAKSKQEKDAEIKRLSAEIGTIKGEFAKLEEVLIDYKRYKEVLFKLSPPTWQEAQKAKVLSDRDAQDMQKREPEDSASSNVLENKVSSPGRELPSIRDIRLSSAHSNALEGPEYKDAPELYFTDPQQLLDLMSALTDQTLSLMRYSSRVEETVYKLRQSMETTKKKIEKDEEPLMLQIIDLKQKIEKEKTSGSKLKQNVQLHVSLNTKNQDVMRPLGEKIAEVYCSCVDDRMTNLSILEKLASIEKRFFLLLQDFESIPEKNLEMIKKIKDNKRRTREREEKLRVQREKQEERMRRYLERSLADSKKKSGRKLMYRSMPVAQKVKVKNEDNVPAEDELHAYLFTCDDIQ